MAEIFHQSFQVLHDGREHGLLVHVGHASIASPPEAMGLFGLAEQMFDAVTRFSGDLVATCTRQIPGGDKRFGLSELLTPFAQVFQISASPLPDGDCGRLADKQRDVGGNPACHKSSDCFRVAVKRVGAQGSWGDAVALMEPVQQGSGRLPSRAAPPEMRVADVATITRLLVSARL